MWIYVRTEKLNGRFPKYSRELIQSSGQIVFCQVQCTRIIPFIKSFQQHPSCILWRNYYISGFNCCCEIVIHVEIDKSESVVLPNRSYTFAKISVNQLVQQQTNNLPLQLDSEHVYSGLLWQLEGAQPFWARVYEPRLDSTRAINFKKSCTCMGGWSTNFLMRCENPQQNVERCG